MKLEGQEKTSNNAYLMSQAPLPRSIHHMKQANRKLSYCSVLQDDEAKTVFKDFLKNRFNEEQLLFLERVSQFEQSTEDEERGDIAKNIFENFLNPKAPYQINISDDLYKHLKQSYTIDPLNVTLFEPAQIYVNNQLKHESFADFYTSPMYEEFTNKRLQSLGSSKSLQEKNGDDSSNEVSDFSFRWTKAPVEWSVCNVVDWMCLMGFEEYKDNFKRECIDGEVLLSLTSEDLLELKVSKLGHRKTILRYISSLKSEKSKKEEACLIQKNKDIMEQRELYLREEIQRKNVPIFLRDRIQRANSIDKNTPLSRSGRNSADSSNMVLPLRKNRYMVSRRSGNVVIPTNETLNRQPLKNNLSIFGNKKF